MKSIGYLKHGSKFYAPIDNWIDQERNNLELGMELQLQFESKAYTQKPIRAVVTKDEFAANFKADDITRFCARLKALATVLKDKGLFGEYVIAHVDGVCKVQKLDVDEEMVFRSMQDDKGSIPTTYLSVVEARRGQGVFRSQLIELDRSCLVSGINNPSFLRASHIKPWKVSTNLERLDPHNGLLLSPHLDLLFDSGWITFDRNGYCQCSSQETEDALRAWNIEMPFSIGVLSEERAKYMSFHNQFVFKGYLEVSQ